ncbi:MAG TPA: transcriptional repressor [Verrucomicrobiales bacterium]|nr:transcriptional repressor [Verrucomicrobiales bacterium]HIL69496.1 transcriptional repressor [Verrucomicrobiota bacterium]
MTYSTKCLTEQKFADKLSDSGLRYTTQRYQIYSILLSRQDHPTANEVYQQTKENHEDISMATVYNTLETLIKCGLVREVNLEKTVTRYCPNMKDHWHFYCENCGKVFDMDVDRPALSGSVTAPSGFTINQVEVAVRGACQQCPDGENKVCRKFDDFSDN